MHPDQQLIVTKASGEKVPFEPKKILNSLTQAGALPEIAEKILEDIQSEAHQGISTRRIYQRAFNLLRKHSRPLAAKYKLKRAVMELGPSGYPFEYFVGELLKRHGYQVQVGVHIRGKCISHEVDVLGDRDGHRIAVECKFGATPNKRLDVKIPLYIRSRVEDLIQAWRAESGGNHRSYQGWIVTNGTFSPDAQDYGVCAGLRLMSWNFPHKGNLKDFIEHTGLYPLTTLITLTKAEKKHFLDKKLVLVKSLQEQPQLLEELQLSKSRLRKTREEVEVLCH